MKCNGKTGFVPGAYAEAVYRKERGERKEDKNVRFFVSFALFAVKISSLRLFRVEGNPATAHLRQPKPRFAFEALREDLEIVDVLTILQPLLDRDKQT
ncbi:MAG: hypothetical protein HY360_12550 [Verrucomicrobia bacterium]|nr:hypothetical protein [Verrucomicrobiota bacterium]